MVRLQDLPQDVLLCIMHHLEVVDILCSERACKAIHDVIVSRQLWLSKLHILDECCAPGLPPYIHPNTLTDPELRDMVVKAERSYYLITKGTSPTLKLECVRRVSLARPEEESVQDVIARAHSIKVTPDGRYLFMVYPDSCEPRLFDLEDGCRRIWASNRATINPDLGRSHCAISYAFEQQRADRCITVALLIEKNTFTDNGYLQVLRLELPSKTSDSLQEIVVLTSVLDSIPATSPVVSEELVAFITLDNFIIVWNCKSRQSVRINIPSDSFSGCPSDIRIWHDHIFFMVQLETYRSELWTFSLSEIMTWSHSTNSVVLDVSDISRLEMPTANVHYTIHRGFLGRERQTTTVFMVGISHGDLASPPKIVSARARFDTRKHASEKWAQTNVQFTGCPWDDIKGEYVANRYYLSVVAPPSNSGQLIVAVVWPGRRFDWRFAFLTRSGGVVLRRFPEYILPFGDSLARRPGDPPRTLALHMEPCSGMLAKIKNIDRSTEVVELFRIT